MVATNLNLLQNILIKDIFRIHRNLIVFETNEHSFPNGISGK